MRRQRQPLGRFGTLNGRGTAGRGGQSLGRGRHGAVGFARYSRNGISGFAAIRSQHQSSRFVPPPVETDNGMFRQGHEDSDSGDDDEGSVSSCGTSSESDDGPPVDVEEVRQDDEEGTQSCDKSKNATSNENNGPLSPWKNSKAKKQIVHDLKSKTGPIHMFIGTLPVVFDDSSFKTLVRETNYKQIHELYASRYKLSNFKTNMKSLLGHYVKHTGPFAKGSDDPEPWTSRKERSKGWNLLFSLRMNKISNEKVNRMTTEELWESNSHFKCYPLSDFIKYDREMKKLTDVMRADLDAEEARFHDYCTKFPAKKMTDRNEPFWYNHPAKSLLEKDVKNGLADELSPRKLRETRQEYKDFKPKTFLKHIHQEKERQRGTPYWKLKRNIIARENNEREREEMRVKWVDEQVAKAIDETTDGMEQIRM